MFYTVYKITNKINNKYYIGMHKTDNLDDGYMGSGKIISQAVEKYGAENFIKEILHIFDNEEDMKSKEKELVILEEMSYNLCPGGKGGFGYINNSGITKFQGKKHSEKTKKFISEKMLGNTNCRGKILTEEHKNKISSKMKLSASRAPKSEEQKRKISETLKRRALEKIIAAEVLR